MAKSASTIALVAACLVTAITLTTTFFLTLNAVITYVSGNWRTAEAQQGASPDLEPIMLLASADVARRSLADGDISATESANAAASSRIVAVVSQGQRGVSQDRLPSATPPQAASSDPADTTPEGAPAEPGPVQQDPARASADPILMAQTAAENAGTEQQRCSDPSWPEVICREASRWTACHPDKWDTVPECSVQKFDSSMQ